MVACGTQRTVRRTVRETESIVQRTLHQRPALSPPPGPATRGRKHTRMSSSGPSQSISQMTRTLHKQRHVGPNDNTEVGKANFIISHDHIYCAVYKWGAQNRNYLLEGGPLENRLPWLGECSRSPSVSVHQLVLL